MISFKYGNNGAFCYIVFPGGHTFIVRMESHRNRRQKKPNYESKIIQ